MEQNNLISAQQLAARRQRRSMERIAPGRGSCYYFPIPDGKLNELETSTVIDYLQEELNRVKPDDTFVLDLAFGPPELDQNNWVEFLENLTQFRRVVWKRDGQVEKITRAMTISFLRMGFGDMVTLPPAAPCFQIVENQR